MMQYLLYQNKKVFKQLIETKCSDVIHLKSLIIILLTNKMSILIQYRKIFRKIKRCCRLSQQVIKRLVK